MKTIVAALDNSLAARPVLAAARRLGELLGAEVEALHIPVDGDDVARDAARCEGLELRTVGGRPVETLIAEGERADVMALALGARGRPLGRRPLGTTALAVATAAEKPVLVVPPDASHPEQLRRVLVPLEGTLSTALASADMVLQLAEAAEIDVVVVHVHGEDSLPLFTDQPQHEQEAWVDEFIARYCPWGVASLRLEVRVGRQEELIPLVADEMNADVIALGWAREVEKGRAPVVRAVLERGRRPVFLLPIHVDAPARVVARDAAVAY